MTFVSVTQSWATPHSLSVGGGSSLINGLTLISTKKKTIKQQQKKKKDRTRKWEGEGEPECRNMARSLLCRAVGAFGLTRTTTLLPGIRFYSQTETEPLTVRQQNGGIRYSNKWCLSYLWFTEPLLWKRRVIQHLLISVGPSDTFWFVSRRVILNNPKKRNALSLSMLQSLRENILADVDSDDLRVIIISGIFLNIGATDW